MKTICAGRNGGVGVSTIIKTICGETFDILAIKAYGSEREAGRLLAANPGLCHKMRFDGGEALVIPDIAEEPDNALPPWKRA